MVSLYIHIPFCEKKCKYCSFFVYPFQDEKFVNQYFQALQKEIIFWAKNLSDKQIKTIYFGWWTPALLWKERLSALIDLINKQFDLSYLEELSIELNPNPYSQILDLIQFLNRKYWKKFFRLRFSFGLQTFDDAILQQSWRWYVYNTLIGFLRDLQKVKQVNNVFNFDFIAFGSKRRDYKYQFFEKFVNSLFADSFSIYTLELFPGSQWYDTKEFNSSDEEIYEEFQYFKSVLKKAGYSRYEISNFALPGKESIHNLVYWNGGDYIGLGLNASSFVKDVSKIFNKSEKIFDNLQSLSLRWTNTTSWKKYFDWKFIDKPKVQFLTEKDVKIELFFLKLRTKRGVENLGLYQDVLVSDWENKMQEFEKQNLVYYKPPRLVLTDKGMDLYHQIVPELLEEI